MPENLLRDVGRHAALGDMAELGVSCHCKGSLGLDSTTPRWARNADYAPEQVVCNP